jgi:excisionase family DNA binding protein
MSTDDSEPPASELPEVLTVEELAALLRLNRKTVYDALKRGEIPGARLVAGRYRIHRDTVVGWLRQGCGSRSARKK